MEEIKYKVAKVIDEYTLVINAGKNQGIKSGFKFLIYSIGEDIKDPDTGESLGKLEVIKGTAKVSHVQDNISTVKSDTFEKSKPIVTTRRQSKFLSAFGEEYITREEQEPIQKPFENPEVGDFAKYIA